MYSCHCRMEKMKKILVSDYDRTFYLNKEGIKKNIEAVEKFRKMEICLL